MKRKWIALVAVAALALCGCEAKEPTVSEPELLEPVGVRADRAEAVVGPIDVTTVLDASVVPAAEDLYFEIDGVVDEINVVPGQAVHAGDVLVTLSEEHAQEAYDALAGEYAYAQQMNALDNRLAELEIESLNVQLDQLRRDSAESLEIENLELDISEKELLLRQQRERQALDLESQAAALEKAASKLGHSQLIAPFDGRVGSMAELQPGAGVTAYSPIVYLIDETQLTLQSAFVYETQLAACDRVYALIGAHELALEGLPLDREEYTATVLSGGTPTSRFRFVDPLPEDVAAGDYAAVCLVSKSVPDALLIPANALFRDSSGKYVYVYEADGETRVRRSVETGVATDWQVQITDGLEEGEIVYVAN